MSRGADVVRAEPGAEELLRALLEDSGASPYVRISAAQVMGRLELDAERALSVLMALIEGDAPDVHRAALHALIYFSHPPPSLVPELIAGLADAHPGEVFVAKMALTAIGGPAVPALCAALSDERPAVRRRATQLLGGVRRRYAEAVCLWPPAFLRASPAAYARRAHAQLAPAIRGLCGASRDPDPTVRRRATEALGFGAIERIPIEVLGEYLDVLIDVGHDDAADALAEALSSEDASVVIIAAARKPRAGQPSAR